MKGIRGYLAIAIGAIMVISSLTVLFGNDQNIINNSLPEENGSDITAIVQQSSISAPESQVPITGSEIKNALTQLNIPDKYAYLPNANAASFTGSKVTPLYTSSPAPMGVTDYGFMQPAGLMIPYEYATAGFQGTVKLETLKAQYLMNSDPSSVSIQLNAVLDNVTVNGQSGYVFWVHNVMYYTPSTGEIQFIDNIWSLSSPSMVMSPNSILSGSGSVAANLFYYYAGPSLNMSGEFTANLFLKAGLSDGNNAVYFGYSITNTEMNQTRPLSYYDTVVFNSQKSGSSAPVSSAAFKVDGFHKTPSGLLYDVELVLGGPGGGSLTTVYAANGQFNLKFLGPTGAYTKLPAAYNFGSNTGEAVQGLSCWWTSQMKPVIHLSSGPSLLISMWASQISHSGAVNIQGTILPPNAFVFMSVGKTINNDTAAWAPINSENGTFKFSLPGRIDYSGVVMLTGYQPFYFTIAAAVENETEEGQGMHGSAGGGMGEEGGGDTAASWLNVTLVPDTTSAVYTPLYANSDDQLQYISESTSGNTSGHSHGTDSEPYTIENIQGATLNSLFASTNSYLYPSFSGIFLKNTDATVLIKNPSAFKVNYPQDMKTKLTGMGLPMSNDLNLVFYNTSGVILTNAKSITGWIADTTTSPDIANVQFMDSSDFLVSGNTFKSMSASMMVYNHEQKPGSGTISGNYFLSDPALVNLAAAHILNKNNPVGLYMYSSGNLVYNNYFGLANPAVSPGRDYQTGEPAAYSNSWNLPEKMSVYYVKHVHGMALTGSIVDTGYQGGNYWIMHNDPSAFNATGSIVLGADLIPLVLQEYNVAFHNVGLASGISWGVTFNGISQTSTGSEIDFAAANGSYPFEISKPSTYSASPMSGNVAVYGATVVTDVYFTPVQYRVDFIQHGLPDGIAWGVAAGGQAANSASGTLSLYLQNGTYRFDTVPPDGYYSLNPTGTFIVYGDGVMINVSMDVKTYTLTFIAKGIPSGMNWEIVFNGAAYNTSNGELSFSVADGNYSYAISDVSGYSIAPDSGSVLVSGNNQTVSLAFSPTPDYGNTALLIVIGTIVGIGAMLLAIFVFRRR